jgi:hypothetical protein
MALPWRESVLRYSHMSKVRDSKQRLAFVQLFAEASPCTDVPEEIDVVPTASGSITSSCIPSSG